MERQKTQNRQHNIEGEKQSRTTSTIQLQDLLKSYGMQDSVVWVKEQTKRSMQQNRQPRNRPT